MTSKTLASDVQSHSTQSVLWGEYLSAGLVALGLIVACLI